MDLKDPVVYAGSLVWCDILFRTITSRNPDNTIRKMKDKNLNEDHNKQVMIYSNSASNAEGALLNTATAILENHSTKTKRPMTYANTIAGGDGIKKKTYSLDCFGL